MDVRVWTETDHLIRILERKAPACRDDGSKDEVDKTRADRSEYRESKDYACMCVCVCIHTRAHIKGLSGESQPTEKGTAVTGSGEGSHSSFVSCELNPEPLILWFWRLRWSL